MKNKLKMGDIVQEVWETSRIGIILKQKMRPWPGPPGGPREQLCYVVYWSNDHITEEPPLYLKKANMFPLERAPKPKKIPEEIFKKKRKICVDSGSKG